MNYSFHPDAEAEFLESVGYYESVVAGLGHSLIDEFDTLARLICESPKSWKVERSQIFVKLPFVNFRFLLYTVKRFLKFKF